MSGAYFKSSLSTDSFGKAPPDMNLLAKARKYERGFPWFVFDALPGLEYQEIGSDYINAILNGGRTGEIGDGKVFVLPLEECIRIRTGETGVSAIS